MMFNEAVANILSVSKMSEVANEGDYFNFVNSFPGIDECKDQGVVYTFNTFAAKLAKQEKLKDQWKKHYAIAKQLQPVVLRR